MTDVQKKKQTKRPLLPRLRFPEFEQAGAWKNFELGSFSQIITEKVGNGSCVPYTITSGVGLVSQEEKYGRVTAGKSIKNYVVLQKNDFAYNKSATKNYPQGFIARYSGDARAAVPGSIFTCFRVDCNKVFPGFLDGIFSNNFHGKWLNRYLSVGARSHGSLQVDSDDLLALPVPIPAGRRSVFEQKKIADCLSSLDDLIAAETRKLEALKLYRKGLLMQVFPKDGSYLPRLRFPEFRNADIWKCLRLSSVCEINPKKIDKKGDPFVSFIPMSGVSENGRVTNAEIRKYSDVRKGYTCFIDKDVLMAKITPCFENGKAALVDGLEGGLGFGSTEFHVFRANELCLPEFLFLQLYRNNVLESGVISMTGNAGQRRVPVAFFETLPFFLPAIEEQEVIVKFFQSIDGQTASMMQKIDALKTLKQGLMQQLFPTLDDEGTA